MNFIVGFLANAIALYCIAKFVPGFDHNLSITGALIAALVFGIVNALLGPILRLISAPLTWLTHGLFSVVVNFILFAITAKLVHLHEPSSIPGWEANLIGAIIMMVVSTVLAESMAPPASSSNASR